MEFARVNEQERAIEVSEAKDHIKEAPTFDDEDDVTPEYEEGIRRYFGLESLEPSAQRVAHARHLGATEGGTAASRVAAGANSAEDNTLVGDRDVEGKRSGSSGARWRIRTTWPENRAGTARTWAPSRR